MLKPPSGPALRKRASGSKEKEEEENGLENGQARLQVSVSKERKSQTSRSRERMKSAGRPVESQFPEATRWTLLDEKNAKGITMEEGSALGREEEKN